jgi:hypothetical protein
MAAQEGLKTTSRPTSINDSDSRDVESGGYGKKEAKATSDLAPQYSSREGETEEVTTTKRPWHAQTRRILKMAALPVFWLLMTG